MTLFEFAKDHKLYISLPHGGERNIAEIFETDTGFVFFDVWWYMSDGHPVHYIDGEIRESELYPGSWVVIPSGETASSGGFIYVSELTPDKKKLWTERLSWDDYRANDPDGEKATREYAQKLLAQYA